MYATIIIPEFGLQTLLRHEPASSQRGRGKTHPHWRRQPIALLDATETQSAKDRGKARVIELTAAALQQGVQLGMKASHAQARCRKLRLLTPDRAKEELAQAELLDHLGRFTPDLEATQPGIGTLDLFSTRYAPRGGENFAAQILASLAKAGFTAHAGVANNPEAALLAARIARPALILPDDPRAVQDLLRPYPIEILEPDANLSAILRLWGIRQVGDLLALPRDEVTERLGEDAGDLWDQAAGGRFRLLKLVRVPESYVQEKELEYAVETLEPLLFLLRRMLETLAARLEVAYRVAARLVLTLRFEDGAGHERAFQVPDPCRDVELLFRMLHTHLEGFTTVSPIVAVRLEILPGCMLKQQFQLFETTLKDPNRFAETLSRLEAILGTDRVGSPRVRSSHRPDPVEIRPYLEPDTEPEPSTTPPPARFFGLPLRRFRPPAPVQVWCSLHGPEQAPAPPHPVAVRRDNQAQPIAVRTCHGPWRLSGDWWDGAQNWLREEWDAALEDGTLCRLAQVQQRWFLEGIY